MRTSISRDFVKKKRKIFSLFSVISFYLKVVLLVTDGKQTTVPDPREKGPTEESKIMQDKGIDVHSMGVGQLDPIDLLNYSSNPSFVDKVDDFTKLDSKVTQQAIKLCPRKFHKIVHKIVKIRLPIGFKKNFYV